MAVRFATRDAPSARDGEREWNAVANRLFPSLDVIPTGDGPFRAEVRSAGTRDLQITDISATSHRVEHHAGTVTDASLDLCKVSIQLSGRGLMRQGGRELVLEPGSIAFYDTTRGYHLDWEGPFRFIVAMFPASAIHLPKGAPGECAARRIPADTPISRAATAYLSSLAEHLDTLAGPGGERLERTGIDLLTSMVEQQMGRVDDERSTLVAEVCADVNARLGDRDLDVPRLADRHGVSVRRLQTLFAEHGEGPAEWIRRRRLQECARDLADPLQGATPIATVAARWGFDDPGYFGRVFRRAYGCTASEWRASGGSRGRGTRP